MRLDTERLALLDGDVATILGTSWTTLPNTSVVGTNAKCRQCPEMSAIWAGPDVLRTPRDRLD